MKWHKHVFKERLLKINTRDEALVLLEEAYRKCKDVNEIALAFNTTSDIITKYLIELDIFNKKFCYKCDDGAGAWCNKDQFSKNSSHTDGLRSNCKSCTNSHGKQYYAKPEVKEAHKEYLSKPETIEARKVWYKEYYSKPEAIEVRKEYHKEYYSNPEVNEREKERRSKPEAIEARKEYNKEYYSKLEIKEYYKERRSKPEAIEARKEYNKEYRSKPETKEARKEYYSRYEVRERIKARFKERYNTDIAFRIRINISSRVNQSLKVNNTSKMGKSISEYLPYTIQELMNHLESKFLPGMTWDNHSYYGWHVDHKKPVSSFKITSMECEEFQECWALKNLQPLWSDDNWTKSNKYEELTDEELDNLSNEEFLKD